MKIINTITGLKGEDLKAGKAKKVSSTAKASSAPAGSPDAVRLSDEGKFFVKALTVAGNTSVSRQEQIEKLKKIVQRGEYTPDTKKLAYKLLTRHPELLL